jgi:predicted nucleotidyltransferase
VTRDSGVGVQAQELARRLQLELGEALVGVYVHGSVALGCFSPGVSDLDLIVVSRRRTSHGEKAELVEILAQTSGNPAELEIHFLAQPDFEPWRHPTPFDFHYSDDWRAALQADLEAALARQQEPDPDLAAHIAVARRRGVAVFGPPPAEIFPEVPWEDYADALLRDLRWVSEGGIREPLYRVLSPARVWATLATKEIHSKETAAAWALERARPDMRPLLASALARYRGETDGFLADEETLRSFVAYAEAEVAPIASRYARS